MNDRIYYIATINRIKLTKRHYGGKIMIDALERITYYREQKNWTEYQLAERSGLTQSTISSWYRKNMIPSIPSLDKICNAFGITLSQFFSTDNDDFSITSLQKELLIESGRLTEEQQTALLALFKTF